MPLASKLRVLSKGDLNRMHEASLKILEETGAVFQSEEVLNVFKKNGAKISGQIVRFPTKLVEAALEVCPSSFKYWARNESNSITIGNGQERIAIAPNMGPVYIQDLDNGRRRGTLQDLANIFRLCQASTIVNHVGAFPVEPHDIEPKHRHLHMMYHLLKNTDKPLVGVVRSQHDQQHLFDMVEIAIGKTGFLLDHPTIAVSINPLSPLTFDTESCETILAYAKRRQPVFIAPSIIAGETGPINLFGTATLQNAEMLAGMVLVQLINPGNPVVFSPGSSVANMKRANYITGSPEANLMNIAGIQMAIEMYDVPARSFGGLTDAKTVDCQAGYETMQNLFMLMLSGVHLINECLGTLDSLMTTSYEKFIIDEEMISRVIRVLEGMDTSDEAQSVAIIQEVAHSPLYLMHPNTLEHFRKSWRPTVSTWDTYDEWREQGSEDVVARANRMFKEILQSAPESLLDPEVDKELQAYMNRVLQI